MDFWISAWISGFLDFTVNFWISVWISADGVQDFFRDGPLGSDKWKLPVSAIFFEDFATVVNRHAV